MEQALARWGSRVGEGTDGEAAPLLDFAAVAFGYRYRSAAVLGAPEGGREAFPAAELTGQPGTRAPHVWLARDGQRVSTIDLFGCRFVLMTGTDGGAWVEAAQSIAGAAVDVYRIGRDGDLADVDRPWAEAYGVSDGGAVLVRPDGVVAWRCADVAKDPARELSAALSLLLAVGDGRREAVEQPA